MSEARNVVAAAMGPLFNMGVQAERERINAAIENAPIAFDFFGPYIARDKLLEILSGEN